MSISNQNRQWLSGMYELLNSQLATVTKGKGAKQACLVASRHCGKSGIPQGQAGEIFNAVILCPIPVKVIGAYIRFYARSL